MRFISLIFGSVIFNFVLFSMFVFLHPRSAEAGAHIVRAEGNSTQMTEGMEASSDPGTDLNTQPLDLRGFAAMFGLGIAVFGAAMGQGRALAAAMEGISRNPGARSAMFTPLLIGLALIEALVLLAFLVTGGLVK